MNLFYSTVTWYSLDEHHMFNVLFFRKAVVCPIIDVINDDDFAYLTGSDMTWVCFIMFISSKQTFY